MLTARKIEQLAPRERTFEISDSIGLALRVTPRGTKAWRCWWTEAGCLRRRTIGRWPEMSAPAARAERDRLRAAMSGGTTFAAFAELYLAQYARPYKRSAEFDARLLRRHVIPEIGHRPLVALTRFECAEVLDVIRLRGSRDMASRVRSVLRKVLYFAVERGALTVNPAARLHAPQSPARDRVLTADEIAAWFAALEASPPAPRRALLLQLLTAARLGEVVGITRGEIDHRESVWHLPAHRAKTGKARAIPLSPPALAILEPVTRTRVTAGHLLDTNEDACRRHMREAVKRAGLPRATPHDLRRSCATHLAQLGTDRETIDRILGHVDSTVGGRYDRYERQAEQRAALEAWAEKLDAIVAHALTTKTPVHAPCNAQRQTDDSRQDEHGRNHD